MRQVVLAQRDLDFHPGIGVVAQHLDHAADGLGVLRGLLDDFRDHDLAVLRVLRAVGRDEDVLVDALVLGDEEHDAMLDEQAPAKRLVGALQHFDDGALAPAAAIQPRHAREHGVAVQGLVHLLGAEEEVLGAVLGLEEAEAVRVPHDLALDEARLVGDEDGAAAVAHHLAFALHGRQAPAEGFALFRLDVQQVRDPFLVEGDSLLLQHLEDHLAAGQRVLVTCRFAFAMRVILTQGLGFTGQKSVSFLK